jgi:hypothetical protein
MTFGSFLGGFEGKPGRYNLEVEVLSNTSCLNLFQPRLYIIASNNDFYECNKYFENLCWTSFFIAFFGFVLVIAGINERLRRPADANSNLAILN